MNDLTTSHDPQNLEGHEQTDVSARAIEFIALTACRSGEALRATWSEIDWEGRKWNRPAGHMKGGEAHSVPLSSRAIEILRELGPPNGADSQARIFGRTTRPFASAGS